MNPTRDTQLPLPGKVAPRPSLRCSHRCASPACPAGSGTATATAHRAGCRPSVGTGGRASAAQGASCDRRSRSGSTGASCSSYRRLVRVACTPAHTRAGSAPCIGHCGVRVGVKGVPSPSTDYRPVPRTVAVRRTGTVAAEGLGVWSVHCGVMIHVRSHTVLITVLILCVTHEPC